MAILEHFGLTALTDALKKSGGVHEVWNLLSLEPNLHSKLDRLDLWFEHTPQVRHSTPLRDLSVILTDHVCSPTVIKSACSARGTRDISGATLWDPNLTLMVPLWWSSLFRNMRESHRLTPSCLPFTQRALGSRICLVPPNSSTSWNGMRKKQKSSPLMGHLLCCSAISYLRSLSFQGSHNRVGQGCFPRCWIHQMCITTPKDSDS